MTTWTPDPSFYPSPRLAAKAPPERHAYVVDFDPERARPDGLAVVDVDPQSSTYARVVGRTAMPGVGDEPHHFGWNACSSCLCPNAPHPHVERRYLIVPGVRSSNIHILDTKPDPTKPALIRTITAREVAERDRCAGTAPQQPPRAQRGAADGRGEPGRPPGLLHQFAVRGRGLPVLPRWGQGLDGQGGRQARRGHRARHGLLHRVAGRPSAAPGAPAGRRRVV
jgi:hypothetical protein